MATEQGGVPWWSNIIVAAISIAFTHAFTLWRERDKVQRDWHSRWIGDTCGLVAKLSDAAIQHYTDPQSLADTSRSAGIILSDFKRLGRVLRETNCKDPSMTKKTMDAFFEYHACITSDEDFQDGGRTVRRVDDDLCERVREIEAELDTLIKSPRSPKNK